MVIILDNNVRRGWIGAIGQTDSAQTSGLNHDKDGPISDMS